MMKSPGDLAAQLARQWQNPDKREQLLLNTEKNWPLKLNIGKPGGKDMVENISRVRKHIQQWRRVSLGTVHWEKVRFRSTGDAVDIPTAWELATPSEWINAVDRIEIHREYQLLERLAAESDPMFHPLLVRQRHLVWNRPEADVIKATRLAMELTPGCARGNPLRTISLAGIDSKFFERNRSLMIRLLDIRFQSRASDLGLEGFLGALDENAHWLLLADLDGNLLSFSQQRVRAKELRSTPLPASQILIVENEKSLYQLPNVKNTIAILGAGLNLAWMNARWLANKNLAYWGDIDTWGLTMLARARHSQPGLTPLLMTGRVFKKYHRDRAVTEPHPANPIPPDGLLKEEIDLYNYLLSLKKGRLEQEFLPVDLVSGAVTEWGRDELKQQ